ncbi:MAG: glycogen synthase GlgA [Coprobacillaceae bacterium]
MKIVFVASEATPFIKTGGLGDVIGSLPEALKKEKQECIVILPNYQDLKSLETIEFITSFDVWVGWRKQYCGIFKTQLSGVTFYFIDNQQYFQRSGVYGYDDDYERFAYFDIAALELIGHLQIQPDIIHLHDWQTAMISVLYKEKYKQFQYYENIKIIFTIHNIAYQGKANPMLIDDMFGLSRELYENGNLEHDSCFNMMKSAIVYSDIISTVSPTYAKEILTLEYGEGLEGVLRLRENDIYGIINGINIAEIYSKTNINIVENYNRRNFYNKKRINKVALQKEGHLPVNESPCIGMVTRLTWQKGIDLVINQISEIMKLNIQLIILGTGDYDYEQTLLHLQNQYPTKLSFQQKYDEGLAQRIYASCDMFLMPSLFEPCGLSQMMAMHYGTIPIVRETGGLKDSVDTYNEIEKTGTGFGFRNYNAHEMMNIIKMALQVYNNDKPIWKKLMSSTMKVDFSWKQSAKQYLQLYKR